MQNRKRLSKKAVSFFMLLNLVWVHSSCKIKSLEQRMPEAFTFVYVWCLKHIKENKDVVCSNSSS